MAMTDRLVEARPGYRALERLLSTQEVAEVLGVHKVTVTRMADRGELPYITVSTRGNRRFRVSDIERFIERGGTRMRPFPGFGEGRTT